MQSLDPKAVWFFFLSSIIPWIVVLVFVPINTLWILAGVTESPNFSTVAIVFVLLALAALAVCYAWARLTYHFYRYELREDGFRKEHGIIWKKYVTIPYDRIQNVDIYRGIIARILGLSDLQVQTAGAITAGSYGAFSEGRLPGLSKEVAEELRDELVRRARTSRSRDQGL